jgi:hypothetical protein
MWDNVSDSVADNIKQIPLNTRMHIDAMVGPIIETVTFFAVGKGVQYIAKQMAARSTPVGAAAEALEMPSDVNKVVVVAEKVGFVAKLSKAKQVIEASRTFKNAMKVYKVYKITNDVKKGTTVAYHASAIINAEINDDIELPMLPWDKSTAFFGAIPMPFTYGAVPNYVQQAEPKLAPGNNPYVKTGVLEDTDLSFVRSYAEVFSTAKDPLGFLQLLETGAYEGRSLLLPLENADGSQSPVIHVVTSSMHLYHRDTNSGQKFTNKVDLASHQYVLMNASSLADSIEIAKDISGSYAPDTDEDFELAVGARAAQIAFDNLGYDEAADSFDELPFFPDFTNKLPDLSDSGVKNIPDYVF